MSTAKLLEPADLKQCQVEWTEYRPFTMGGSVHHHMRCTNRPHWLVKEVVPAADGLMGEMSMCDEHAAKAIELGRLNPPENYDMDWIGS